MVEDNIIIRERENLVLLPKHGVLLKEEAQPTTPVSNTYPDFTLNGVAFWGLDNLLPDQITDDVKKTPVLASALDWLSRMWISGGLVYGKLEIQEDGTDKLIRKNDVRVNDFFRKNQIASEFLPIASKHGLTYWKLFYEIVLGADRKEIIGIKCHKSPHGRVYRQNPKTGRVENCKISANWAMFDGIDGMYSIEMPVVQKGYNPVGLLKVRTDSIRYCYIVDFPGYDETYYPTAPWHSNRESKWITLAQSIPVFKEALMRNKMTISYVISIHPSFWAKYYDDWDTLETADKKERKGAYYKSIENCLNGASNAGKNIFSTHILDDIAGKFVDCITITPIKNETLSGEYLEDSQEASAMILYSLGFDGTLIGQLPSKSFGSGSGSDKREAWNLAITNAKPYQDKILEVFNFIAEYNGWVDEQGEPYTFWFKNYYVQTLDQVSIANRQSQVGK